MLILLWLPSCYRVEWRGGIMLTSLDAEGMKKDQFHVENIDGVSPYFNRTESPKDFEGNSDDVANWCRKMTLYFNNWNIDSEWEKIEFALSKITEGRKMSRTEFRRMEV